MKNKNLVVGRARGLNYWVVQYLPHCFTGILKSHYVLFPLGQSGSPERIPPPISISRLHFRWLKRVLKSIITTQNNHLISLSPKWHLTFIPHFTGLPTLKQPSFYIHDFSSITLFALYLPGYLVPLVFELFQSSVVQINLMFIMIPFEMVSEFSSQVSCYLFICFSPSKKCVNASFPGHLFSLSS